MKIDKWPVVCTLALLCCTPTDDGEGINANGCSAYFPLAVGNTWSYRRWGDTANSWVTQYTVSTDTFIHGECYYSYGVAGDTDRQLLRCDAAGKVYLRENDTDYLYFDFAKSVGDTYHFTAECTWPDNRDAYVVTLRPGRFCSTPAGTFVGCVDFYFDIPGYQVNESTFVAVIGDEHGYVFSPGVGMVSHYGWVGSELVAYELH